MDTLQEYYDLKVLNRSNHRLDRLVDFVAHTNDYKLRKFRTPKDMPNQLDKPSNLGEKTEDMPIQRDKPSNLGEKTGKSNLYIIPILVYLIL
ncbi:hypothetical protein TNCV_5034991 [Trichonephila clavipes]|nr:hypothetical protein TNCV_5034991 [Trichonephila clavipes]